MNAVGEVITEVCRADDTLRQKSDFHIGTSIPAAKIRNLVGACVASGVSVPDNEFIALIDCTVFGSCKNGLAIGESGFSTHNDWTAECKSGFIPWSSLVSGDGYIRKSAMGEVQFLRSGKIGIELAGSDVGCDDCVILFEKIRSALAPLIGNLAAPESPAPTQRFVSQAPWVCEWCGRSNVGAESCRGCGAPPPG